MGKLDNTLIIHRGGRAESARGDRPSAGLAESAESVAPNWRYRKWIGCWQKGQLSHLA
jgi:hypothetical protein